VEWTPVGQEPSPVSAWPHLETALAKRLPFELRAANVEDRRVLQRLSEWFGIRANGTALRIGVMFGVASDSRAANDRFLV